MSNQTKKQRKEIINKAAERLAEILCMQIEMGKKKKRTAAKKANQ